MRHASIPLMDIPYHLMRFLLLFAFVKRRDGVSESQFNQVLNIELDQIIEVCVAEQLWILNLETVLKWTNIICFEHFRPVNFLMNSGLPNLR